MDSKRHMSTRSTANHENTVAQDDLAALVGGIVVSCQARPENPLHGSATMALMARAAEAGGAKGLRANGADDVRAIRAATSLPVMGIAKIPQPNSPVMITPTVESAQHLLAAGARLIALDATRRPRPAGQPPADIVRAIHDGGGLAMGDLATIEDLGPALAAGVDAVGSTLSGYTDESPAQEEPDLELVQALAQQTGVPVYAEGRIWTPEQVSAAFAAGASFVVVGTAITNPMAITQRFVEATPETSGAPS